MTRRGIGRRRFTASLGALEFAKVLRQDLALWQRVALASGVRVE